METTRREGGIHFVMWPDSPLHECSREGSLDPISGTGVYHHFLLAVVCPCKANPVELARKPR